MYTTESPGKGAYAQTVQITTMNSTTTAMTTTITVRYVGTLLMRLSE